MLNTRVTPSLALLMSGALLAAPLTGYSADPAAITENDVITGTMLINFKTRTELDSSGKFADGSPKLGVKDEYKIDMRVAQTTEFSGAITRQPKVKVKLVGVEAQAGALNYDINLAVLNPNNLSQKKTVGKWVGTIPIETAGNNLDIGGGKAHDSQLRIAVDTVGAAQGFSSNFNGKLLGKPEKGADWKDKLTTFTFERVVGNKKVKIEAKQTDPVQFQNISLAKGPSAIYPQTLVNGRMDYDYETGNWYLSNIRFKYNVDGTDYEDVLSGSIKWVETDDRAQSGRAYYDFNLRFNEDRHANASTEADAFNNMSDEEAFFAVDDSIPTLTGRAQFVDTFIPGSDMLPASSNVTYNLNANKLTKQQVMNFFKLWMLAIGPVYDE
jgi:hypothetical protein